MKKIEAVIRPERLNQVKNGLEDIGAVGLTVHEVKGRGKQKGVELASRVGKYRVDLLPKMLIHLVVPDEMVDRVVDTIIATARTGDIGDGKIFVYPVEECIRIRTGEKNEQAI